METRLHFDRANQLYLSILDISYKSKIFRYFLSFILVSGVILLPYRKVNAGIFSQIFSTPVSASIIDSISADLPVQTDKNLQNIDILQSGVSLLELSTEDLISEDNAPQIVSENALLPTISFATEDEDHSTDSLTGDISFYVVRKGDSLSQIAEMFDVSTNTILWANDLSRSSTIKEGDVLLILPIDGVQHTVIKGDTLKSIALKYKVEIEDIKAFNDLPADTQLAVGNELIIPNAEMSIDAPVVKNSLPSKKNVVQNVTVQNLSGYFINPVPVAIKTQGIHGKNAVDLAAPIGTPIYAAAEGVVIVARTGWSGGYGNMLAIQHPNGTQTLYSHLSRLAVTAGQTVTQGEIVGYVGNSGRVRAAKGGNGAHLHFEVHGAKNPGVNRSWKSWTY